MFALDAEFIKTGATFLCRSIAWVPLRPLAPGLFGSRPVAVALTPAAVMENAIALPCGHALAPLVTSVSTGLEAALLAVNPSSSAATAESIPNRPVQHHNNNYNNGKRMKAFSLDPYTLPNAALLRRTAQSRGQLLHDPFHDLLNGSGASFDAAVSFFAKLLLPYGRGKPTSPSFAALCRHHPETLQQQLRNEFGTSQSAMDEWLAELSACSLDSMNIVSQKLRALAASSPTSVDAGGGGLQYDEVDSLAEMSDAVWTTWHRLDATAAAAAVEDHSHSGNEKNVEIRGHGKQAKAATFLCYGPSDAEAIRNTVRLACLKWRKSGGPLSISPSARTDLSSISIVNGRNSPMQFVVSDVTRSGWFRALGFESRQGATPSLLLALEKVAKAHTLHSGDRKNEATELLASRDEHNPLWDAQALAAIARYWV